jgi:hypothetical protein
MADDPETQNDEQGISRRKLLRGAAIAGGTLMWSAPVIKSAIATPALASCIGQTAQPCGFVIAVTEVCSAGPIPCCPGLECRSDFDIGEVNCYCLPIT